jgi:hypothetical protein
MRIASASSSSNSIFVRLMPLPNTIIVGAPKSGSSSLYWWLSSHPEVCASKTKETHFFDDGINPRFNASANGMQHGLDKYLPYFEHCSADDKVIMEATPIYMYQKNALKHLSAFEQKPKIIFVLREPSVRAHSQFRFNKYRLGNIPRDKTYVDYLRETKSTDADPLKRGEYIEYIDQWMELFGEENIHVLQLEKVFKQRVSEMKKLAEFLEIDPAFYDRFDFVRRNETRKMRSTKLHRLGLQVQPLVPQWLQEKVLIPLYLKMNSTAMPPLSVEDKQLIESHKPGFHSFNQRLQQRFPHIDLELWK